MPDRATRQRVLVLGGSGHIGAAIVRALLDAGHVVTAASRDAGPRANLDGLPVRRVSGDDDRPGVLEHWIDAADVVIDAAVPYPVDLFDGRRDVVPRAERRAARIIAATRAAGAALVHVSSFTTLPPPGGSLRQVGHGALHGLHPYFELKERTEAMVLAALASGLRGMVLNPSTCLGPYDLKPRDRAFIPLLLSGEVRGLSRGALNVIDVRDLAAVTVGLIAAGCPERQVRVFGHDTTLPALARHICALGGVSPPRMTAPTTLGVAASVWMETAFALAGRRSPWPSLPMLLVSASYHGAPSPAQLAAHPGLRAPQDTLRDALRWYRQIGHCP